MKAKVIKTISDVDIVYFPETDKHLVPIMPIIHSLNMSDTHEVSRLFDSALWSNIARATSTDETYIVEFGLIALPIYYIPGWLLTIERDPRALSEESFNKTIVELYDLFMNYNKTNLLNNKLK